jgi:hypothetical protein
VTGAGRATGQTRQHQRGRSPQISCQDRRSGELVNPLDNGAVAVEANISPHAVEFSHVAQAIFENRFSNQTIALADGHQRHKLGLHIGRKAWERPGLNIGR